MSAQTPAERKQAERDRKRDAGLKLVQAWIDPADEEKVRRLERKALKKVGLTP